MNRAFLLCIFGNILTTGATAIISTSLASSFIGLCLMLMAHFFARRILSKHRFQTFFLNIIAGIAIAYAFVDVFPHLAHKQVVLDEADIGTLKGYLGHHVYLMALLGFCAYVGMRVFKASGQEHLQSRIAYIFMIGSMCAYAMFIGYMLAEQPLYRIEPALLFGFAMAAHFLGVDHTLIEDQNEVYDGVIRYLLMVSTVIGWIAGFFYTISATVYALAFAYIAGGIVAVGAISDLPRVRTTKDFSVFLSGVLTYSAVLLLIEVY